MLARNKWLSLILSEKKQIMGGDVCFTGKAYCKIILHAAKYPHCAVNGVLLADASEMKKKNVVFVDAIPLFHIQLNLTPMSEIALTQVNPLISNNWQIFT